MKAAWHGKLEMVRFLVKRGADRFLRNDMGETAADCAAQNSHHEIARLLREWSWK
jgi:ankyrin repeat protein